MPRATRMYFGSIIAAIGFLIAIFELCKAVREWKEAGKRWDADTKLALKKAAGGLIMAVLGIGAVAEDLVTSKADAAASEKRERELKTAVEDANKRTATAERKIQQ